MMKNKQTNRPQTSSSISSRLSASSKRATSTFPLDIALRRGVPYRNVSDKAKHKILTFVSSQQFKSARGSSINNLAKSTGFEQAKTMGALWRWVSIRMKLQTRFLAYLTLNPVVQVYLFISENFLYLFCVSILASLNEGKLGEEFAVSFYQSRLFLCVVRRGS